MQKIVELLTSKEVKKQINNIAKVFKNLPHLPKKLLEIIVKITPFFALVGGLVLIFTGIQGIFGLNRFEHWYSYWSNIPRIYFYIVGALEIISGGVYLLAYKPLKERKINGWMLLFWTIIIKLLKNIVNIIFAYSGILGSLFSVAISLYILFEIRAFYEKKAVKKLIKKKTK